MKSFLITSAVASLLLASGLAQAKPDPLQVRSWAASCFNCHGTDGRAEAPARSGLAGLNKDDMYEKLLNYKSGAEPAIVMHQLTKGYSDEQLEAIASWFAAQKK